MGHGAGMPLAFLGKIWDWGLAISFPKRAGSVRPAPAHLSTAAHPGTALGTALSADGHCT